MLKNFLLTATIFILSSAIFYTTIQNLDPLGGQQIIAITAFFLSIFCGVASFATFLFFFGAEIYKGRKLGTPAFLVAVRRGMLVAIFIGGLLVLQFFRLLSPFEATLLAIFLSLVEYIFISAKRD
ncbi:hypothetical protein K9M41_03065 [Candidatus Gracilibacteria bacterium]|nr:hypothetical protein [Candidatus Gracilibacteria bacterium]